MCAGEGVRGGEAGEWRDGPWVEALAAFVESPLQFPAPTRLLALLLTRTPEDPMLSLGLHWRCTHSALRHTQAIYS